MPEDCRGAVVAGLAPPRLLAAPAPRVVREVLRIHPTDARKLGSQECRKWPKPRPLPPQGEALQLRAGSCPLGTEFSIPQLTEHRALSQSGIHLLALPSHLSLLPPPCSGQSEDACSPSPQAFPTCIQQASAALSSTHELLCLPCGGCPWISAVFCSEGCGPLQGALAQGYRALARAPGQTTFTLRALAFQPRRGWYWSLPFWVIRVNEGVCC